MRAHWVCLVVLIPLLAGCLSGDSDDAAEQEAAGVVRVRPDQVPSGAELNATGARAVLTWANQAVPFRQEIQIPEGTTLVTMTTTGPPGASVRSSMLESVTARRRCNADALDAWNVGISGTHTCSGTALIDPPEAKWIVQSTGPQGAVVNVQVEFEAAPLDGLMAHLNLSRLSMPVYEVKPTTGQFITASDGVELWVEVTLPEGPGPWPTVIAASPYNGQSGRIDQPGGTPAMWGYFTHDWARRGYAVVNADVRGFGLSGGCVEVWGANEQRDQKELVEWVAQQSWSDGRAGFYGQSYVGTTPVEAAVQAPEALKAIIAVAPVINAYEDWHYGGVPNGENAGSPVAYQVLTDVPGQGADPASILANAAKGVCDPTLVVRANDPRAVYDEFYEERNFKLRAASVKAAVLYTQGFEDSNVKSMMIPGWFNEIQAPKLGLFGHWVHQHPTRADEEILFLGWMDQFVKGVDLGLDAVPPVQVSTNVGTVRDASLWPDDGLPVLELWPDYVSGKLSPEKAASPTVDLVILPASDARVTEILQALPANVARARPFVSVEYEVEQDLPVTGVPILNVRGTLLSQGNAYLAAELYDDSADGRALVSYGMFNLAHENGHDRYDPVAGRASDVDLPFLPTEWVFEPGHKLVVELRAVQLLEDGLTAPGPPGAFRLAEHPDGVGPLRFSVVDPFEYRPMPAFAKP